MAITHARTASGSPKINATDWNDAHVGSGLPSQWTDGGHGDVTAATDDDSTPLTVQGHNDASADAFVVRHGTVRAARTIGTGNASVVWTAVTPGVAGNSVRVTADSDFSPGVPLSVAVVGSVISVTLGTDGGGDPSSTATQVIAAVAAHAPAAALAAGLNGGNGTGIYQPVVNATLTTLQGGLDAGTAFAVDETGHLAIPALADNSTTLTVAAPDGDGPGYDGGYALAIRPASDDWNGGIYFSVGDQSNLSGHGYIFRAINEGNNRQLFDLDAWGSFSVAAPVDQGASWSWKGSDDSSAFGVSMGETAAEHAVFVRTRLLVQGVVIIQQPTAPADGDLNASQVAFWFDDTDGAAKLKIKGKSADGTVVTGSVNLT